MCGPAAMAVFSSIIGYLTRRLRATRYTKRGYANFSGDGARRWHRRRVRLPRPISPPNARQCSRPVRASSRRSWASEAFVAKMKARGIAWWATATTVAEARAAVAAGAEVIVAQGAEAGGHRGAFDASEAELRQVGLFALLPAIVNAVDLPVVATGGIADARGVAAALVLGASAVQIGTGFLRSPEAKIAPAWADALAKTAPEDTLVSRVFSGRPGRSIATAYARAATAPEAPAPAPYPIQRGLTAGMRGLGTKENNIDRIQAWAGQSAALAAAEPAGAIVERLWAGAQALLGLS
jgi:nitronate monooxygenase